MAFNEKTADRIREALVDQNNVVEKYMFGGVCFMVNEKMCIGVIKDDMMIRIDPNLAEEVLSRNGCRVMDFQRRPMKGYFYIDAEGMKSKKDFDYWINLCLSYNKVAKLSKKKASRN
ncbi:MAG TPA: TfoX/Sxy family protein [Bacteroidia bacterium]|nr:TfoX/Sxy family protein [Bacteroidia bacterium]